MQHQRQQQRLDLKKSFPYDRYSEIRELQREAFEIIEKSGKSVTLELPTGTGKTDVGGTFLRALSERGEYPLFYITPTKVLVNQVHEFYPEITVAYGRNEYGCLYWPDENLKADEIPCSMLVDCAHRVDQETGETFEPGAVPCPYLQAKYQAKGSRIVVCTMSFYLFTQFFSTEWKQPAGLVIDEAHRIAQVIRNTLSYEITDYQLRRSIELLQDIAPHEAAILDRFLKKMIRFAKRHPAETAVLLEDHELEELIDELVKINPVELRKKVGEAIRKRQIDPKEKREVLQKVETLSFNFTRYITSLGYSLESEKRKALNYTYAFYREELVGQEKVQYKLVIKAYYVNPIVKRLLGSCTVAYSATIGDAETFGFETGIDSPFYPLPSPFSAEKTRVFMPKDTPNLAVKERSRREPTKVLRRIARACRSFAKNGARSLVVVVSEKERQKFLVLCDEEKVKAVSYGNGVPAKEAALRFKGGEGDALIGTVANFGEGIDLPKQIAPVIFFLRPGYPSPTDPMTVFEERRYGSQRWRLWNWRVMIEALQVRGRNVRSTEDVGVTFFISQQFRRFLFASLPQWLEPAYRGDLEFEECMKEAEGLLKKS